ncbi:methylmalonyl-CoA mutase [Brucella canis CNGB 1324]|nr:methylmalonyl-CoA mutase [Brucella canis CNGB 1324]
MTKKTRADWETLAEKELKRPADSLVWHTPEGIDVKPLYTQDDLEGIGHLGTLPGFEPFLRGPRATMYAGSGNMRASPLRRNQTPFIARRLPPVSRAYRLPST